jgi:hypothetical protein
VVEDHAETIHIHSETGCMLKAYQLRGHVRWCAPLQPEMRDGIRMWFQRYIYVSARYVPQGVLS